MYKVTKRLCTELYRPTGEFVSVGEYNTYEEFVSNLFNMVVADYKTMHFFWTETPAQIYVDNNSVNFVCAEELENNEIWLYYVSSDKNEYTFNTVRMG